MRGVLLQSLRKYGNAFAILASAVMFGIFHGNAVQMPFAFLCGLVIGYAVVATESLWTGVIIHALMNAMSGVSSALVYYVDEYASNTFFYVASATGIVVGVFAFIIYATRYKNDQTLKIKGDFSDASTGEKLAKFISAPIMIVAIILFVIEAATQLTTTPPVN
jgi:heme/copper-type cytochrome/quinol oxidase subunit 2